jgi:DNA polymerase III delta prime subunit
MKRSLFDFAQRPSSSPTPFPIPLSSSSAPSSAPSTALSTAQKGNDLNKILKGPDLQFFSNVQSLQPSPKKSRLLIDVVKPQTLSSVIGHSDAKKTILTYLLNPESRLKPVLLISGPSGCGKSLILNLALKETNFQKFELGENLSEELSMIKKKPLNTTEKKSACIVVECLEGLSNEERSVLLKNIKSCSLPFILTCDDAFEPNMKIFREGCIHVKMAPNDSNTILRILFQAGESAYGLKLSAETASNILVASNQNARLALNTLQLLATTKKAGVKKGSVIDSSDESFSLFGACSRLCAAVPNSFEKSLTVSSGDSDMFVALLQQNAISSLPAQCYKLNKLLDSFVDCDLLHKRFLMDEGSIIPLLQTRMLMTQKPEKQSQFPLCFSLMSSQKSKRERLKITSGVISSSFLSELRGTSSSLIKEQEISRTSNLVLLSQVRPGGTDAHDTMLVVKSRVSGRTDFRVLTKESLYVPGDPLANSWIKNGIFKFDLIS